jgi:hypothetical protein
MERNEVLMDESESEYNRGGAMVIITGGSDDDEEEPCRLFWCSTVALKEFLRISVMMYSRCTGT